MKQIKFILITLCLDFTLGVLSYTSLCLAQNHPWTQKSSLPWLRWGHSSCELNGKVYILGGMSVYASPTNALNTVWMYDPLLDTCIAKANMDIVRTLFSTCVYNGKIYAIGGTQQLFATPTTKSIDAYDPEQDSWTHITDMPVSRYDHTASLVGSKIYIIGGFDDWNNPPFGQVDIFDLATYTWTTGAPMPTPRVAHCAVVLNGKIYAIGGHKGVSTNESGETTVEVYDPATDTWTSAADLLDKRKFMSACTLDGQIYVFGGGEGYCTTAPSWIQVYRPETDNWINIGDMPVEDLYLHTSTVVDNIIYITGGARGDCSTLKIVSTIYAYDPSLDLSPVVRNFEADKSYIIPGNGNVRIITELRDTSGMSLYAVIEAPDGNPVDSIQLFDDGAHKDENPGDSLYANTWFVGSSEEQHYYADLHATRYGEDTLIHHMNNLARFTTIGPVKYANHEFTATDQIPQPGDGMRISITLTNEGNTASVTNIEAKIICLNPAAKLITDVMVFNDIEAGSSIQSDRSCILKIEEDCPENTEIAFQVNIYSDDYLFWKDTFSLTIEAPDNVHDILKPGFRIYPNPATEELIIEFDKPIMQATSVILLDITGKAIYSEVLENTAESHTINLSSIRKGVYLINISNDRYSYSEKMIKVE